MSGITQEQARTALESGWNKDALVYLHEYMNDIFEDAEACGDFAFRIGRGNLIIYKSYDLWDIDAAFRGDWEAHDGLTAFADGSGSTGDKNAGVGVVLYAENRKPKFVAENIGLGTNNRAELCAVWAALRQVPDTKAKLLIRTDSEYAIGALTKTWTAIKNAQLIANIRKDLALRPNVTFKHVYGHQGAEGNEIADRLATTGRKLVTQISVYEG